MSPSTHASSSVNPIQWRDDRLVLLDQRLLPAAEIHVECATSTAVVAAIRDMVVRGAPAIGIAGAYGMVLAAREAWQRVGPAWRSD